MMTLLKAQKFEILWVTLGIIFNTLSYWQIFKNQPALSSTDPIAGNVFMAICGVIVFLGIKGFAKTYTYTMPFLTLSLAYSGWFLHINAFIKDASLPNYASFNSWYAVIIINTFGLVVMAWGSWLAFHQKKRNVSHKMIL